MHSHPFHTIEGDIAFGPDGEWTEARPIWAQYHDIKGHDVEQFRIEQMANNPTVRAGPDLLATKTVVQQGATDCSSAIKPPFSNWTSVTPDPYQISGWYGEILPFLGSRSRGCASRCHRRRVRFRRPS
jgi:hypothetical protein